MKVPFSYRHHQFRGIWAASLSAHLLFIGSGSGFSAAPQFSVRQAPTSMEVILVPDKPEAPRPERTRILTTTEHSAAEVKVDREPKPLPKKAKKAVYQPKIQGSRTSPRPDSRHNRPPVYPQFARDQGWEGLVVLELMVRADGHPSSVKIFRSSGYDILDRAALRAVEKWRFVPARLGKLAFASNIRIPVRFVLTVE